MQRELSVKQKQQNNMSNLQRLRDNIAAIECALKGEGEKSVLDKYTGFGGLGFILNRFNKLIKS